MAALQQSTSRLSRSLLALLTASVVLMGSG
jgi:hypothetical protein